MFDIDPFSAICYVLVAGKQKTGEEKIKIYVNYIRTSDVSHSIIFNQGGYT